MSEELKYKLHSPGDCLSEQTMFDYIDHKLSPKERHLVEKHMLDCDLCSDAMEGLELVKDRRRIMGLRNSLDSKLIGGKEAKVISFNFRTVIPIAAAIALLVVGVFFFNKTSDSLKSSADMAQVMEKDEAAPPPPAEDPVSAKPAASAESSGFTSKTGKEGFIATTDEELAEKKEVVTEDYKTPADETNRRAAGSGENINGTLKQDNTIADDLLETVSIPASPEESVNQPALSNNMSKVSEQAANKNESDKKREEQKANQGPYSFGATATTTTKAPDDKQSGAKDLEKSKTQGNTEVAKESMKTDKGGKFRSDGKKSKERSEAPQKTTPGSVAATGGAYQQPNVTVQEDLDLVEAETRKTMADSLEGEEVVVIAEEMPKYPGGEAELLKFIQKNLDLSTFNADGNTPHSSVYVTFIVTKDGSVRESKMARSISPSVDQEVLRVIRSMPKWIPGKQNGKPVNVQYNLPIRINWK